MEKNVLREALAKLAHDVWARWMKYQFSKCDTPMISNRNCLVIPSESVERWTRQMNTPYEDLPESEKKSDREIADETLAVLPRDNSKDTTLISCEKCGRSVDTGWSYCPWCVTPLTALVDQDAYLDDDGKFHCSCGATHTRGPINGAKSYRCLGCGYVTNLDSGEANQEFLPYPKGWDSIESAPKDGTAFWAFFPDRAGYAADQRFANISWSEWGTGVWQYTCTGHKITCEPSHWSPLPQVKET